MDLFIETKTIGEYGKMLAAEEKSAGTIEKYLRDVKAFALWLDKRPMSKDEQRRDCQLETSFAGSRVYTNDH